MFFDYLRRHYKIIIMLLLFVAIFAGVFSLYDLPVEAVGYASALCLAVGAALFTFGYTRYARRCRTLLELKGKVTISIDGLPEPKGELEREYQELVQILYDAKRGTDARLSKERREAEDYYTMWAHQIKTPIAAMGLLLQQSEHGERANLRAELFRIEQYVDMALSFVRLDSDQSDLVLRKCDLDSIIRSCLRKYAGMFILKKLPVNFEGTSLTVLTDEKWLAFVIEQLLSNSLKYTREGSISIYARGNCLVISDTGMGILQEDLPRVFDRGFTGYNGRAERKATGLGLYLSGRVCKKLGHGVSLESVAGRGTSAVISFSDETLLFE